MKFGPKVLTASVVVMALGFFGAASAFASWMGPVSPYDFSVQPRDNNGTVNIFWDDDGNTNRYDLLYGTDPKNLTFGSIGLSFNKSSTNIYTVGFLNKGQTYYFELVGETAYGTNNSGPVSITVPNGGAVMALKPNPSTVPEPAPGQGGPVGPYNFMASSGQNGTVRLNWTDNGSANSYNIIYGLTPTPNQFGLNNLPFSVNSMNTYYVGSLSKGVRYYFTLITYKDGAYISTSAPVSAIAK